MQAFLDKISLERAVLRKVNATFGEPALHGLTQASLAEWSRQQVRPTDVFLSLLYAIARDVGLFVERSGERPGLADDTGTRVSLERQLEELDQLLAYLER